MRAGVSRQVVGVRVCTVEATQVADLVAIPCRAQILDLETVPAALQLLALAGRSEPGPDAPRPAAAFEGAASHATEAGRRCCGGPYLPPP